MVFFTIFELNAQAPLQTAGTTPAIEPANCISGDCENGLGTMVFENGNRYEGSFQAGKFDGNGLFKFINGDVYTGEFKAGLFSGKGAYTFDNGDKYVGELVDGYFKYGSLTTTKGNVYTGGFLNNLMEGEGTLYGKASKVVYRGKWTQGMPDILLAKKTTVATESTDSVYRAMPAATTTEAVAVKPVTLPEIVLTIKESGKTIELVKGQYLIIQLDTNMTTGYTWSSISNPETSVLQTVSNIYIPYEVPSLVGKGGIAKWVYKANEAGTTNIEFNYTRAWEQVVTSNFKVDVVVK